jgi:hypothetical protein
MQNRRFVRDAATNYDFLIDATRRLQPSILSTLILPPEQPPRSNAVRNESRAQKSPLAEGFHNGDSLQSLLRQTASTFAQLFRRNKVLKSGAFQINELASKDKTTVTHKVWTKPEKTSKCPLHKQ